METSKRRIKAFRGVKLRIDPENEVNFRVKLAEGYLDRAEKLFNKNFYRECAEASQLSVENAAKAIISLRRIPSLSLIHI